MMRSDRRRVVVTGVGLVSPLGIGTRETWEALLAGESGIGPITRFDAADSDCRIAGEVKGFEPERWVEKKEVKKMDLFIHYALAASQMALEDSGFVVTDENAERVGVVIGSGIGGFPMIERRIRR
jgi:3-oxoacyl-[acyl-carrier-protein] synthase II